MKREEEWRPIPGGAYSVSDMGRVRRETSGPGTWIGRVLSPDISDNGYPVVILCTSTRGRRRAYVHRLVCAAFHGEGPGLDVNHKNGIKVDNRSSNLEWVTRSRNNRHAYEIGLRRPPCLRGEALNLGKLTEDKVRDARARHAGGESCASIARSLGVATGTVLGAVARKTWRHVP